MRAAVHLGILLWAAVASLAGAGPARADAERPVGRWCASGGSEPAHAPRPNVIVVMTDDQRWDSLAEMPRTLERLAGEGLRFENSFVTTPLCGPSRAGFLTGRGLRDHGVFYNDIRRFDPASTLATWLQEAGYATGILGKYINGYEGIAPAVHPGWDRWQVIERPSYYDYRIVDDGELRSYGDRPEDYSTDVLRELAVDFIEDHVDRPFFLYLNTWAPHDQAVPAPRHAGLRADEPGPRPPSYREEDLSDKANWIRWARYIRTLAGEPLVEQMDEEHRAVLEALLSVDELVEALLDTLLRLGIDERTMVVFTSDNGLMRGEHWLYWKVEPFEESIRVPLVIRYPPLTAHGNADAERRSDALVVNLDLTPTIASLAGAAVPRDLEGRSLAPLLCGTRDAEQDWRRAIVLENDIHHDFLGMPAYRGLRTHRWKYLRFALPDGRLREELYRIDRDPAELDNLAITDPDRRQHHRALSRLSHRLDRLMGF